MRKILWAAIFGLMVAGYAVGSQQDPAALLSASPKTAGNIVSVDTAWSADYGRPGDQIVLAIIFRINAGYHINADSAQIVSFDEFKPYPTRIMVKAATEGVVIESPRYPKAQRFKVKFARGDLMTFAGQTVVYLPMKLAEKLRVKFIDLKLEVSYQACDDSICLFPEKLTLNEKIAVAKTDVAPAFVKRDLFASYVTRGTGNSSVVQFDLFGWYFSFNAASWAGLTSLLVIAAFGGMLLNFTPCVLPLIPIKVICLADAAENRRRCLALGLTMFLGVFVFWIGLGSTIALFSGFNVTNQLFQYPIFTVGVGAIIAVMAFGMCGLFSVRLPKFVYLINPNHETLPGSFGLGVLTAVLSTPCTAPFMGAAAAWAATQKPATTLFTFAAIGAGMALPYLMLSVFPDLIKRMPKTGPASVLIKEVMGLFMLAAAAYFIGVGVSAIFNSPPNPPTKIYWWFVMGFCAAAGGWLAYRTLRMTTRRRFQICFVGLGLLIVAGAAYGGIQLTDPGPIEWVHYTPDRFEEAFDDQKIVVTVFTAEWCLNCKALEQGILHSQKIVKLFAEEDIVPIKVDITGNNAAGKARLRETGHLTIPLLVIYAPGGKEIFRGDFYSADQIQRAIDQARRTGHAT